MAKYRSLDDPYAKWIIKEYTHWTLMLNDDQRYLGRTYAWLLREGEMQRFSEITDEEASELRVVMQENETALRKLWDPDFMNYAWLANFFHLHKGHGHIHFVPRYKDSRTFADVEFVDGRWGNNFSPYEKFPVAEDVLLKIRDEMRAHISGSKNG